MRWTMSIDIYNLLDELAARGRRLRGQLAGDYKPVDPADPTAGALVRACALMLDGPAVGSVAQKRMDEGS